MSLGRVLGVAVACVCLAAPAALAAPIHPVGLPLTLTLPSGWTATGSSSQARFNASGPSGGHLAVTSGGSFPKLLPFSVFMSTESAAAKKAYRAEDPHASVSSRKVILPSGPAVETSVRVNHGAGPTAIDLYSLLHNGVTYHFTFYTSPSQLAAAKADFTSAAKSIRWTS
jgi:hypothetical protein